jgi:hypothetical protein
MACRGGGRVISNLGGTPKEVACPWCEGTGVRVPGIDAQARWPREDRVPSGAAGEADAAERASAGEGGEDRLTGSAGDSDPVPPAA